jgi:hypothetical protein
MDKLIITPKTKVWELLNAFPGLEEPLIELAPEFKKLKNPILRRTIARVTSLQQAAAVGQIPVDVLVNKLRNLVGQDSLEAIESGSTGGEQQPGWFVPSKIVKTLDARPIISSGGHPLPEVLHDVQNMNPGDIYELITPFLPAPLIDKVSEQGCSTWSKKEAEDCFLNYFLKKSQV